MNILSNIKDLDEPTIDHSVDKDLTSIEEWQNFLISAWEKTFPCCPIRITDDFFDLVGTDSPGILAMKMRKNFEKVSGTDLNLALLFEHPTIERLAHALAEKKNRKEKWPTLVKIKEGGEDLPLFCFHPLAGNSIWYREIAKYLPSSQKVYGLEAPGMDKLQYPFFNMEDLAAFHIVEMKKVQPQGPYLLAGYSFGGLLAFEVALQLERSRDTVGLLAIIDRSKPVAAQRILAGAICPPELVTENGRSLSNQLKSHWKWSSTWMRMKLRAFLASIMRPFHPRIPFMRKIMKGSSYFMMMHYKPGYVYQGNMLLLRQNYRENSSFLERGCFFREDYGWSDQVKGKIEIRYIPGEDHLNIMSRPYVKVISSMIGDAIEKARAKACRNPDKAE